MMIFTLEHDEICLKTKGVWFNLYRVADLWLTPLYFRFFVHRERNLQKSWSVYLSGHFVGFVHG